MGFKQRRGKGREADQPAPPQFQHSSGANTLEGLLGEHTLKEEAEPNAPKGYRARSIARTEKRKAG
jgi:hypothetical protein